MTSNSHESSQEYVNNFQQDPKYFEMVAGIIDHLTYIEQSLDKDGSPILDGEGNPTFLRKRIKPAHKEVYRIIKKIAGSLVCVRTTEYIANMVGCSKTTVTEAKKALSQSFEQLAGNPLITITEKHTKTKRDDKVINKKPVHVCGVNPIWNYNNAYMSTLEKEEREPPTMCEEISLREAEIAIEKMGQTSVAEEVHKSGAYPKNGMSPKAYPKNGISPQGKKEGSSQKWDGHKTPLTNPFVIKTNPTDLAVQMSLINQENVGDNFQSEKLCFEWLSKLGFRRKDATSITGTFDLITIWAAANYVKKQIKKGKVKSSITGYLLLTLEKKWWEPKVTA